MASNEVAHPLPHLVIEPGRSWSSLDLREIWKYRELLYFLTWRDVKVRYKQTMLGAAWAVLQPLLTMLVFTLLFGKLAKLPSDNVPYPLFAFAGLLPWTFFSNAVGSAGNSVVGNPQLVTKVYFPRLIVPAAAVLAGLVDFGVSFLLMCIMMAVYRVPLGVNFLLLPVLIFLTAALAMGIGTWLASLNVKYRDIRHLIPFTLQLWMYVTPVAYPLSLIPRPYRALLIINPMTGLIEGYRVVLLSGINGASFNWTALGVSVLMTAAMLVFAAYAFRRFERLFADLI
jgi:lipopolysaccharide transport system permease protein